MSTTNSKHGIKAIIIATLMVIATLSIQYYIGIKQDEKKCAQIVDRELQIASMKIETYLSTTQQAIDNIDDQIIKNLHSTDSIYIIMKRIVASNKNITGCAIGFIPYYYPDKGYWFEPSAYRQNDTIKTMQAGSKNHDYFNMEWYKSAINAKNTKTIWTSPYRDNTLNNLLMTSYCRVITIDNKPIGVVSLDLSLDYVSKTLSNIKPYNGSICQLHTRDGKIIVSTDNTQPTTSKYLIASQPIAQQKLTLQIASPKNAVYGDTILINLITLLLITITLLLLAYIVRQTIRNINKLNTVRQQQNIVENELRIARSIQTSMLPKTFPPYPDCDQVEIYGKLTPAKSVGGDLYDFFLRDQKLYFIIGDVSGKGIPASLVMSVTRTLFRTISNHETQPQRIVSQLSDTIAEENQLNMFVTLFIGVIDLTTGEMTYSNAGHDAPYLISTDGKQIGTLPVDSNIPAGVMQGWQYTQQHTTIAQGTTIFLYTYGLTEAEDTAHQQYGQNRITDTLNRHCTQTTPTPNTIVNTIIQSVHQFVGNAEQSDDLTLMAIKYTP